MNKNQVRTGERHSGFELLRMISMAMIIVMHAIGHGGMGASVTVGSPFYCIYWLIYGLCKVSTNCFVMLTGYYMITSEIRLSRAFRIWCEVFFYSLLTYLLAVHAGCVELSFGALLKVFLPITSNGYWFATGYVLLYLCIPLLNRVIRGIRTQGEFRAILLGMLILTSLMPTVFYWADPLGVNGGYSYIWFIVLYMIAAYIRLYDISISRKAFLLLYFGLALTVPLTRMAAELVQAKIGATNLVDKMLDYKMPITVLMSIAFFLRFKQTELRNGFLKKTVLFFAPMSFGVYLLHDGELLRKLLWERIRMTRVAPPMTLLYLLVVTAVILAVGYAVSFLYHRLYCLLPMQKAEKKIDRLAERCFFVKTKK